MSTELGHYHVFRSWQLLILFLLNIGFGIKLMFKAYHISSTIQFTRGFSFLCLSSTGITDTSHCCCLMPQRNTNKFIFMGSKDTYLWNNYSQFLRYYWITTLIAWNSGDHRNYRYFPRQQQVNERLSLMDLYIIQYISNGATDYISIYCKSPKFILSTGSPTHSMFRHAKGILNMLNCY